MHKGKMVTIEKVVKIDSVDKNKLQKASDKIGERFLFNLLKDNYKSLPRKHRLKKKAHHKHHKLHKAHNK